MAVVNFSLTPELADHIGLDRMHPYDFGESTGQVVDDGMMGLTSPHGEDTEFFDMTTLPHVSNGRFYASSVFRIEFGDLHGDDKIFWERRNPEDGFTISSAFFGSFRLIVPEPSALLLIAMATCGVLVRRRRQV